MSKQTWERRFEKRNHLSVKRGCCRVNEGVQGNLRKMKQGKYVEDEDYNGRRDVKAVTARLTSAAE